MSLSLYPIDPFGQYLSPKPMKGIFTLHRAISAHSCHASWDSTGITVLNASQLPNGPTRIFLTKSNIWYIATDGYDRVVSGINASVNPTTLASGGFCLFVSANDDIYTCDGGNDRVARWSMNGTNSVSAMFITHYCRGLFVSTNNTLYCSLTEMHHVITKSLDDPTNTLTIVAGTGCAGSSLIELNGPAGIVVDLKSRLYVADSYNHRIQRFEPGETNGTTVVGAGAPNTIDLLHPIDIVLDGGEYLFVVDKDHHRIVGSGPDGFRCVAGCSGVLGSASNQLRYPQAMSFDSNGNIWVADSVNERIQKFVLRTNTCGEQYEVF